MFYKIILWATVYCAVASCTSASAPSPKNNVKREAAVLLGNDTLFVDQVDTVIAYQLHQMRKNATKMFLGKELLEKEAQKQGLSIQELLQKSIGNACGGDKKQASKAQCVQMKKEELVDSLKGVYRVKTVLIPPFFDKIKTDSIYALNFESSSKGAIDVYIVSDFSCYACEQLQPNIEAVIKQYKEKVNFKFVYFSDYISNAALACEAAQKENKFEEMHKLIFENSEKLHDDSVFNTLAKQLQLNEGQFKNILADKMLLSPFLETKEFLVKHGIYSTPSFIVNGKVLNEKHSVNYLPQVIEQELKL